jgi:hypothetical protein
MTLVAIEPALGASFLSMWIKFAGKSVPPLFTLLEFKQRHDNIPEHPQLQVFDLCRFSRRLRSTDPRDNVFALADFDPYVLEAMPSLIDYGSCIRSTFTSIAMVALQQSSKILSCCSSASRGNLAEPESQVHCSPAPRAGERIPGLPSWAPDWRYAGIEPLANRWDKIIKIQVNRISQNTQRVMKEQALNISIVARNASISDLPNNPWY